MTATGTVRVAIVLGRNAHPQATLDDLWARARDAVEPAGLQLSGTALVLAGAGSLPTGGGTLQVLPVPPATPGRLGAAVGNAVDTAARKGGPLGIAGRLVRDNLESRRLSRSVARRGELQAALLGADVVVAADVAANRAVWRLRRRTAAPLVHGPVAMMHALRRAGVG